VSDDANRERPFTLDASIERLARLTALAGGAALLSVVVVTVVSIVGRRSGAVGLGPVPGDYEWVEMATAFAVFSSLGWCQLRRGHVTVDLCWHRAPRRVTAAIDLVADLLMTLGALLLAWRLALGLVDRHRFAETTFVLQIPLWWGYAACLVGALVFVLACALSVGRDWRRLRRR
jgi:TRAP-type C4-dicarboxylate transport system permease small subunit